MLSIEQDLQVVNIEVSSKCNLKCMYCSRGKFVNERNDGFMDMQMYENILELLPKDITLAPYLSGEPLLASNLSYYLGYAKGQGFRETRIHTNATLLTMDRTNELMICGLDSIVFSIDGKTPEEYERLRNYPFNKVKLNIENFLKINQGQIKAGVQCLTPAGEDKVLNSGLKDLEDQFDFLILEHPHSWVYGSKIPESEFLGITELPCFFLNRYLTISWDGDYLLCCCCLNKEKVLGNAKIISPSHIFEYVVEEIRQQQLNGEAIDPCSNCERYGKGRI